MLKVLGRVLNDDCALDQEHEVKVGGRASGLEYIDVLEFGGKLADVQMGGVVILVEGEVDIAATTMGLAKPAREVTAHEVREMVSGATDKAGRA